ncbi:hypothetical protein BD324DRAFT_636145 [Kockovaella imperatae]|uniref:NAD(P)-binding domain-containing protein n=1 Tax=Kockovaella imperatae TaxID=4999 RepID=A0A1Y1UAH1_9TREE|nr:hypothetical protein BD324DRAFT_636145 [Kockovaella imperatae]ORX34496.1 hypothetical protein BD324DRAFT_636145 [Kockovaella imperatae]
MKFVIFGGGGKVARHFTRIASGQGHKVVCVVRNDSHHSDLESMGGKPSILSIEDATVPQITDLLSDHKPDAVIFSAGAGGKGDPSRTTKVDFEGAVKVFDAMEAANVRRLLYVGAIDVRDRDKGYPKHYTQESKDSSDKTWNAIGRYMDAKYKAEVELHSRKALQYTVLRPGGLTMEPAGKCQMGLCQTGKTSRELVAKALLACANEPKSEGLTIDLMDGDGELEAELSKVVEQRIDAWEE